ncbi:uncharacterized protein LOC120345692 isoform X1 [Styela clava]
MNSTTTQPDAETEDQIQWWYPLIDPTKMFPGLPPAIAVIMYCCVIVGAVIAMLLIMWLCSSCLARKGKKRNENEHLKSLNGSKRSNTIWSTSGSGKMAGKDNDAFEMQEKGTGGQKYDTLKHLETMPWWDYVSNRSPVNWYDYYQKAERRNRTKTCERNSCHPWLTPDDTGRERKMKRSSRSQKEAYPRTSEIDAGWENVRPRNIDAAHYWHPSKALDTRYFPKFRMIPRATWTNEHLLGCYRPNCYSEDYGNHSLASLTSTDMQIMQMIARRRDGFIRPTRGDVFYGNCLDSVVPVKKCGQIYMKSPTSYNNGAHRQALPTLSSYSARKDHSVTSTPLHSDTRVENPPPEFGMDDIPPPPTPPPYPPPPTPLRS